MARLVVLALINIYRLRGPLVTHTNPLSTEIPTHPEREPNHHGSPAQIELPRAEMTRVRTDGLAEEIMRRVRDTGFAFVALDPEGLRSGSLNRPLPTAGERKP